MKQIYVYLLVLSSFFACQKTDSQDTLILGTIYLDVNEVAEAMLIRDGKILEIGSKETLMRQYSNTKIVDYSDAFIVPGLIDSHVHALEFGEQGLKASVEGCLSVESMVERLQTFFPEAKPGEWLFGFGWDEGQWATQGYPDRELLDIAFPDNPIRLQSLHGFASFYNAKALELAGINATTPEPEVGRIIRRADGSPTGTMETSAQALVNKVIPEKDTEYYKKAIIKGLDNISKAGVTAVHEAGIKRNTMEAWMQVHAEGKLPIRVYGMLDGNDSLMLAEWFEKGPSMPADGFFWVKGIKIFYDGSLGSRTALLRDPYHDKAHEARMTERISLARIEEIAWQAAEKGFQLAIHTIGDEANDNILTLFEKVYAHYPDKDLRWRLEHAQVVLPDFYERAAAIAAIVSMQSSHAVGDSRWAEERLGPERIHHAYAWRKMIKAGVPFVLNSDLPGEPWWPMQTLYFALTRQDLEGNPPNGWYAEEVLSAKEAMHAMTLAAAHAAFQDDRSGSLHPGKWADFTVLALDPFTTDKNKVKDIPTKAIWLAGTILE